MLIFQIISGEITQVGKSQELNLKVKKGNQESHGRCNRATVVMACEHSISFLCGNNIAVSYSSRISYSVRYQVVFL